MRFEVAHIPSVRISRPIAEWNHYWLGGLVPTQRIDVRTKCPNGVAAIGEETTFLNGLVTSLTVGIYTPRTSYYECRAEPYVPPPPAEPPVTPPPAPGVTP